jgi:hypothetical protein
MKNVACAVALVSATIAIANTGHAGPLDTWTVASPVPLASNVQTITFGGGTFVAAGDDTVLTSNDGLNWTNGALGGLSNVVGIAYGNGQFAVVGTTGGLWTVLTSVDARNWTPSRMIVTNGLRAIAYGDLGAVIVGEDGAILTSSDGQTWTQHQSGTTNSLVAVAYGNGRFVAVGFGSTVVTSTNGVEWVRLQSDEADNSVLQSIAYGNGQFVAMGWYLAGCCPTLGEKVGTSTNGISWIWREANFGRNSHVTYGAGEFVAVNGAIVSSVDGVNWIQRFYHNEVLSGITYGNGHFVAVGQAGPILESGSITTLGVHYDIGNGLLTLVLTGPIGLAYTVQSSADFISWQILTNLAPVQSATVTFDISLASPDRLFYRAYSQ